MKTALLLQLPDGRYLSDDFETWVENIAAAHRFIPGAALNACWERFRRLGAKSVAVQADSPPGVVR
jgi:hypothetical protein